MSFEDTGELRQTMPPEGADGDGAPSTAHHLAPGVILAERYRIVSFLGEGGMGTVYLAEHVHMRKRVAIKVLLPELSRAAQIVARFEREAIAAGSIGHPNVAAATDFGRLDDGSFFLVLELIEGRQLRALLDEGRPEPARALRIVRGIVAGVAAAHAKGIVHRDLKPENVMLVERDGDPDFVKVLDFGIAKLDAIEGSASGGVQAVGAAAALTKVGMIIGTPDYMAPEQALGQPVDGRTDLYTVGVMMFELLAGERPFTGGPVTVLRQHVVCDAPPLPEAVLAALDPRIASIVTRLLAKAPAARPASAAELLGMLDACSRPTARDPVHRASGPIEEGAPRSPLAGETSTSSGPIAVHPTSDERSGRARAALAHFGAWPLRRRAGIGAGVALAATLLVLALVRTMGGAAAPVTVGPLPPPPGAAATPEPASETAKVSPTATPTPDPAPDTTAVSSSTGASKATPRRDGKPGPTPRKTGPGGIYVPPPSQWFK